MGSPAMLDALEYEDCEDAMTVDLPVNDPHTIPDDLGDAAPPGRKHKLAPELDPALSASTRSTRSTPPPSGSRRPA